MKTSTLLVALAPALLAGCATNPAEDPLQIKLNDFDSRLGRVERVVSNQSLVDMSRRLDTLEAQLRELRGTSEVLQNGSEALRKQQRDLYADLEKRIARMEAALPGGGVASGAAVSAGGGSGAEAGNAPASSTVAAGGTGSAETAARTGSTAASGAEPTTPIDDQAAYARAFDQLKSGEYRMAVTQFQNFMKTYPQSSLLDNAQYWIGEAYYVTRDYDMAAKAFRAVGEHFPSSRKAPDALLKLGFTQYEQKHLSDARATLTDVVQRFPGTDAARLATERLQKLPAAEAR
jgi:tol-pal system protein YbgF